MVDKIYDGIVKALMSVYNLKDIKSVIKETESMKVPKGLYTEDHFDKSWEQANAIIKDDVPGTETTTKLIADGREYTLYTDGGPYLKLIEVNDPETFELTYDRVLDELLSNPSATGLKVEVTKTKFVATLEYKK